jgi:hypothetical protein
MNMQFGREFTRGNQGGIWMVVRIMAERERERERELETRGELVIRSCEITCWGWLHSVRYIQLSATREPVKFVKKGAWFAPVADIVCCDEPGSTAIAVALLALTVPVRTLDIPGLTCPASSYSACFGVTCTRYTCRVSLSIFNLNTSPWS